MNYVCVVMIYLVQAFYIKTCVCRVHCQDMNALPWMSSGYSCPVTCSTIIDTVQTLKEMDYKKILQQEIGRELREEILHDRAVAAARELYKIYLRQERRNIKTFFKNENDIDFSINNDHKNNDTNVNIDNEIVRNHEKTDLNTNENVVNDEERQTKITDHKTVLENEINTGDRKIYKSARVLEPIESKDKTKMDKSDDTNKKYGCWAFEKFYTTSLYIKIKRVVCTRRSNFDERLLMIMTKILNQYIKTPFKFTQEITEFNKMNGGTNKKIKHFITLKYKFGTFDKTMPRWVKLTGYLCKRRSWNPERLLSFIRTRLLNGPRANVLKVLLEKLFGKNTDLRNNIFDVNNLLKYLRKAINTHKNHDHEGKIILKPRHCLPLKIPGCFCKSRFVESYGQCVKPYDCVEDAAERQYLERIVVE